MQQENGNISHKREVCILQIENFLFEILRSVLKIRCLDELTKIDENIC